MSKTIGERFSPKFGLDEADVGTADIDTATFHDASKLSRVGAVFGAKAITAGKTLTGTLLQATDAAGTGAKVLGTAVAKLAAATGAIEGLVEVRVEQMDHANGFTFVGGRLGSDEAIAGYLHLLLEEGRYQPGS